MTSGGGPEDGDQLDGPTPFPTDPSAWEMQGPVLRLIPVAELPMPHGPFRCRHSDRFERLVDARSDRPDDPRDDPAVGREFLDSLTAWDRYSCSYHRPRWHRIATVAAELFEVLGADFDPDDLDASVDRADGLTGSERLWLGYLFFDPIVLSGDGGSYVNGQHRGCALRFCGAPLALVST